MVRRWDSNPGLPDGRPRCEPDNHAHSIHSVVNMFSVNFVFDGFEKWKDCLLHYHLLESIKIWIKNSVYASEQIVICIWKKKYTSLWTKVLYLPTHKRTRPARLHYAKFCPILTRYKDKIKVHIFWEGHKSLQHLSQWTRMGFLCWFFVGSEILLKHMIFSYHWTS